MLVREHVERYLATQSALVEASTITTLRERLGATDVPAERRRPKKHRTFLEAFGNLTLHDLGRRAQELAAWHATLPEGSRYGTMQAVRQTLEAAKRWGLLTQNPAKLAGKNPQPKNPEVEPFADVEEIDRLADELGPWGPLVVFASETGLRPCEWLALEWRDVSRAEGVVRVERSFTARGGLKEYGKTARSRRPVPLTDRALHALALVPRRLDCPLVFSAPGGGGGKRRGAGGYIDLHNWRARDWYPALEAAGLPRHDVYCMRHTFATWPLDAGIEIFELARYMGSSARTIDLYYGHLAKGSTARARDKLNLRATNAQNGAQRAGNP